MGIEVVLGVHRIHDMLIDYNTWADILIRRPRTFVD